MSDANTLILSNSIKLVSNSHMQHVWVRWLKLMTHTLWCVFAVILPRFCITYRLIHCMQILSKNHKCKWKPSVYMWGNSSHVFFSWQKPSVYLWRKCFHTKNCLHIQFTQLLSLKAYNNNGRSINQPCMSIPCSIGQAGCHVQRQ